MKPVRAVLLALLTLCGTVAGVSLAAGVTASSPTTSTVEQSADGADATLGSRISAFMQSNAAGTGGAVESGMWSSTFDNATNRSAKQRLVAGHVDALRNRLDEIRERKQRLVERREAGEISRLKYESEMSGVVGRYDALVDAINETERRAESSGTNTSELAQLRANSEKVAGPEMSAVARNLSGVDAPGLETANRTGSGATPGNADGNGRGNGNGANGPGNGKANGNANANASAIGNGSVPGNASAVIDAATNATTTNVTDGVGTVTGTLDGTNLTDPTNATVPGRSDGQGPSNGSAERGNGWSNGSNASDGSREPATEESTRVVTSVVVTTDAEPADAEPADAEPTDVSVTDGGSTSAAESTDLTADEPTAAGDPTADGGSTTTLDATDGGTDANVTVGTTVGFALE